MPLSLARRASLTAMLVATMGLAACGGTSGPAGLTTTVPSFTGISATSTDHSVAVRDLYIPDPGPVGYPAGAVLPLLVQVWNNTDSRLSLTGATITGGAPAALIDPSSTAAPATTFDVSIKAGSSIGLSQQSGTFLHVQCAKQALGAGTDVPMTFAFSNGATITADVPIGRFPDAGSSAAPLATC
jgi:hypothetical protein